MEFAAITVLAVLVMVAYSQQASLSKRLNTIERRLELVTQHLGIEEKPIPTTPEVIRHIEAGQLILAIKAYREATGVGLREAKEAVDEIVRQRRQPPGRPADESS